MLCLLVSRGFRFGETEFSEVYLGTSELARVCAEVKEEIRRPGLEPVSRVVGRLYSFQSADAEAILQDRLDTKDTELYTYNDLRKMSRAFQYQDTEKFIDIVKRFRHADTADFTYLQRMIPVFQSEDVDEFLHLVRIVRRLRDDKEMDEFLRNVTAAPKLHPDMGTSSHLKSQLGDCQNPIETLDHPKGEEGQEEGFGYFVYLPILDVPDVFLRDCVRQVWLHMATMPPGLTSVQQQC